VSWPLRLISFCSLVIASVIALTAQSPGAAPPPAAQAAPATQEASSQVTLTVGRSVVVTIPFEVSKIAIANPNIAQPTVVSPREILIDGKAPGTVSLIVWGTTQRTQYDIVVDPGVTALQRQLQALFPGEDIRANETPDSVILTGHASANDVMLRAGEIAEAIAPKAKVINMLQLPGGQGSQQVLLQVRVAEVNRRILSEAGASVFTGAAGYKDVIARTTTQQFPAPTYDNLTQTVTNGNVTSASGQITFSDFLNVFLFSSKYQIGILIKALQSSGDLQSLAEPNLIAYNGQEASFLAGGEIPVPIVQGTTNSVTIQYKEFGVRLNFRPTIAGDVIRLKVRPEVSALDFGNGITLNGFRVPALLVRRAETDVELRDGQSFAIAGLMNNQSQTTRDAVPLLSQVPIIGNLFRSKANDRNRTELMVLVTPHLVRPLNPDEVPSLPTVPGKFLPCADPPCESGSGTDPKKISEGEQPAAGKTDKADKAKNPVPPPGR
jgi:pilus assembly protein CpaC